MLALHERLNRGEIRLPCGDILTSRRLRQIGTMLGMSDGAEQLHYIVELDPESPAFRHDVQSAVRFTRNPLYAIIHEACYADGCVTNWAAERLLPDDYEAPELFTGEHVYSWMFEDYSELRPMREAAELVAQWPWPRLYDAEQLARNEVPVAAAIYVNDMYVEREFSEETARLIPGLRPLITSEYDHNGLRVDGDKILTYLIELARGKR